MSEDRDNIRELLSAYIDGEVTGEESRSVEQAVAKDPELALELHELTAARRLVMGLARQRAPRGFVRKVMARAERKHLLGDHQAGGAFRAARWITLAVAAVVLLAAGIGIIAVNMLGTSQGPSPIANLDDTDGSLDGPGGIGFDDGSLHGKDGVDGKKIGAKAGVGDAATEGGRLVIADEAFDYAVANAKNTSIYTHDVSNTLAVLHETFTRNDVLPLELEVPTVDSKAADKGDQTKQDVSRGGLNFYYNKKQDTEQVQIVVLASNTVIEQLNGDLDKLARVQKVSQAPAPDSYKARSDLGFVARRTGPPRATRKDTDPSGRDEEGMEIARLDRTKDEPVSGKGAGVRAKSKMPAKVVTDPGVSKKAPAPAPVTVVPAAPKVAKPVAAPQISGGADDARSSDIAAAEARGAATAGSNLAAKRVSQTGNAATGDVPETTLDNTAGQKSEFAAKGGKPKPNGKSAPGKPGELGLAKGSVTGPTTRPSGSVQVAGRVQGVFAETNNRGELEILSSQIAKEQKSGESDKQLEKQYSKLNSAFRQQILNDDLRRNVQSQQARGVNIQALVININRRSLGRFGKSAATGGVLLRDGGALSRPRAATTSAPVSESTTQRAARQVDTSR
ncbi:MAG: zf-HC2 domain-containing protein [Phycisphaerae bacterium]|nr:zf-HC2 domain-containing protein [Phycisphaerae bacterium]